MGVPQGGIISPLLSNLILNELDLHVDKNRKEWEGKKDGVKDKIINPVYNKITSKLYYLKKKILKKNKFGTEYSGIREEIKRAIKTQRRLNSYIPNP